MSHSSPWTTRSDCPVQGPQGAIIPPYRIHAYMLGSSKSSVATHVIPYILLFFRFWRQMFDARVGIKDEPGRAPPPRPRRAGRATCTFFYQLASGGGHSFGRCRRWLRCGGLGVPLVALPAASSRACSTCSYFAFLLNGPFNCRLGASCMKCAAQRLWSAPPR